jgi:Exopolyphosphatase
MKLACIDIGTNSIRLMIADFDGSKFSNVHKELEMTRIGYGVNETKLLDVNRMKLSAEVIDTYYKKSIVAGAEHVFMMATSAVRDAVNADVFIEMVMAKTGQLIDVISGELEAEVGFLGVLLGNDRPEDKLLIIDIGGGSTELIVGDLDGIQFSKSINIGAVRLTGAYVYNDPVKPEEVVVMKSVITEHIEAVVSEISAFKIDSAIGIGGTATTIATMVHSVEHYSRESVHQLKVDQEELAQITTQLLELNVEDKKKIIGLEAKRADIILAGSLILEELLLKLKIQAYSVSDYDNLEGYTAYQYKRL